MSFHRIRTEVGRVTHVCAGHFLAENGRVYAAMIPCREPKGGDDLIILFVRQEIRQNKPRYVRINSLTEYFLAARSYFKHLAQEVSKQPAEIDD